MLGSCSLLLSMNQVSSYTVGWDIISNMFRIILLLLTLIYIEHKDCISITKRPLILILIGIVSAFLALSRLPSGISIGIIPARKSMKKYLK